MIQRKISHLLKSSGQGKDFRYHREINLPFDFSRPLLITEKVDGSTMQSSLGLPWKRYDLLPKGDTRKQTTAIEDRYELRPCSRDNPAEKHYLDAFDAHRNGFEEFGKRYPDVWGYFEVMSDKIGARYRPLEPTVRVFDMSVNGFFLPFLDTFFVAEDCGLPAVPSLSLKAESLHALLDGLGRASSVDEKLPTHELEGWVVRQRLGPSVLHGELVAKVRKSDLKKLVDP